MYGSDLVRVPAYRAISARGRATVRSSSARSRSSMDGQGGRGQIQTRWDSNAPPVPTSLSLQTYASCERGMKNPDAWRKGRCSRTLRTRSSRSPPSRARRRPLLLLSGESPSARYGTASLFLSLRSGVLPLSLSVSTPASSLSPCLSPLRPRPSLPVSLRSGLVPLSLSLSAPAFSLSPCLSPLRPRPSLPVSLRSGLLPLSLSRSFSGLPVLLPLSPCLNPSRAAPLTPPVPLPYSLSISLSLFPSLPLSPSPAALLSLSPCLAPFPAALLPVSPSSPAITSLSFFCKYSFKCRCSGYHYHNLSLLHEFMLLDA